MEEGSRVTLFADVLPRVLSQGIRTPVREMEALCPRSLLMILLMDSSDAASFQELDAAVLAFLERPFDEQEGTALLHQITSHPFSNQKKFRKLVREVRQHPHGPYKTLSKLPTTHYFDMTSHVNAIERRYNESVAKHALRSVRERIFADDRYSHLAKRLEYAIAAHAERPKTARQREQERKTAGLHEVLPRGIGPTNFQRINKNVPDPPNWKQRPPVSGGLPNV